MASIYRCIREESNKKVHLRLRLRLRLKIRIV